MLSKEGHFRAPAAVSEPQSAVSGSERVDCRRESNFMGGELDADPTRLRENLEELAALLRGASPRVRRRILQVFGELVAHWQYRPERPISVVVEFLPDAIRMSLRRQHGALPPTAWEQLMSPIVLDLIDCWGIDPDPAGIVWFEFYDEKRLSRFSEPETQQQTTDGDTQQRKGSVRVLDEPRN